MYAKIETLERYSDFDIRQSVYPSCLPPDLDAALLSQLGFAVVEDDTLPELASGEHAQPGALRRDGLRVIQEWIVITPIPAIPPVVSRFQARAALHLAGLLDRVETIIAAPDTDPLLKIAWQDAQEFKRDSPSIAAIATALELSSEQLDELFVKAAQIHA